MAENLSAFCGIELTAASAHPALKAGGGAAFSIEVAGEERLALVHELERTCRQPDVQAICDAIRRGVSELQLPVDADALWQQAWLVVSNGI